MYRSYGGDLPATIFRRVMSYALEGKKKESFPTYQSDASSPDFLKPGETPSPTPTPTGSPTPEADEEPVEEAFEVEPEVVEPEEASPVPEASPVFEAPAGKSYLLPNTLNQEASPVESESIPIPVPIKEESIPPRSAPVEEYVPEVESAPLPEDFSSSGGTESYDDQPLLEDESFPPPATEVIMPDDLEVE